MCPQKSFTVKNLCSYPQRNGWYSKVYCKLNKKTDGEGALKRLMELRKKKRHSCRVLIHDRWKEGQPRANYEHKVVARDSENKAKKAEAPNEVKFFKI